MGKHYSHLTLIDRNILERMLSQGCKKVFIAKHLGVSLSTVYREIKRNSQFNPRNNQSYYLGWRAQHRYISKRKRPNRLSQDKRLCALVHKKLRAGWSPWQIEWHLKHHAIGHPVITHETIYRYIYSHWRIRNELTPYLRRKHISRIKHGHRKKRVMNHFHISKRAEIINERGVFGHWECDLMIFKQGVKYNLITLMERWSRYTMAIKNVDRKSRSTAIALISALKGLKAHVKSITFDQGSEFSQFELVKACLETEIYFCTPGSPQEKGGVENRNGVIRTVFPRAHNIRLTSQAEIDGVLDAINERPMLCLNYRSPKALFEQAIQDVM